MNTSYNILTLIKENEGNSKNKKNNCINEYFLNCMYYIVSLVFGILFFSISNRSLPVLILSILFVLYNSIAEYWKSNKVISSIFFSTAVVFIFTGLHFHHIDVRKFMQFSYIVPLFAVYLYRSYTIPNLMSIIIACLFWVYKGNAPSDEVVGFMIGIIGSSVSYSIILALMNNLIKERDKFRKISITDSLTGLPTFVYTVEGAQKMIDKGIDISLLIIDLDNFKQINDTYGHLAGNKAIIFSGEMFKKGLEGLKYTLGRLGGDEFIVLIQNLHPSQEHTAIKRLYDSLENNPFEADPDIPPIKLSCSIGIAHSAGRAGIQVERLLNEADTNMYENKYGKFQLDTDLDLALCILPKRCSQILETLKEKDMYTFIHSQYVARYARALGETLDMPEDYVKELYIAGWVHDIGKFLVSSNILRKPGKLTGEEYSIIKNHVIEGFGIINVLNLSDTAQNAVKYHHECWDGTGYPFGFANESIPLEGRILKIADVFSAITIKRVYRKRLNLDDAIEEIKRCSGSQFDPQLIKVFISIFESRGESKY